MASENQERAQSIRENFKDMVGRIIPDKTCKLYSFHSLRSGGASVASANGISDRLIEKHGRWSPSTGRETYIKDSKRARLSAPLTLGCDHKLLFFSSVCKTEYTSCSEIVLCLRFFIAYQRARGRSAGATLRIIHIPGDWDGEWSWGRL